MRDDTNSQAFGSTRYFLEFGPTSGSDFVERITTYTI